MNLDALVEEFRQRAVTLWENGATEVADVWNLAADRLEAWAEEQANQLLDLTAAARESGYSPDQLRRYLDEGRLADHGRPRAPLVRRGDLPRRLPRLERERPLLTSSGLPDLVAAALRRKRDRTPSR